MVQSFTLTHHRIIVFLIYLKLVLNKHCMTAASNNVMMFLFLRVVMLNSNYQCTLDIIHYKQEIVAT